ncbi:MAG: hypothetical protein ABSE18_00875 [Minisyncoccia bacterium]|jgi:hypothetical protein
MNSNVSDFSVGLAHEFCITAAKAGLTPGEVGELAKNEEMLRKFRQVLLGYSEVKAIEHVIDLDASPFIPGDWKVEKHQRGGSFKWDPKQVQLYLSPNQQNGKSIEGNKLRTELEGKPVFNANLLDYLLKNPHLIPEEWKRDEQGRTHYIFFWGTIYRNSGGNLCVRCLYWDDDGWDWNYDWLGRGWRVLSPAALRAS